jgi:ATP-dependent DNA helicase RecG
MIFGKESETLEFKKTTGELKEAVISIASILNKSGKGELYFGIRNDGTVFGQQIGDATLRDASKALSDNLKPQIFPTIDMVSIFDRYCIRVAFEGISQPYYAYGRAYIRVADEDKQMSPEQLEAFIARKLERASSWDSSPSRASLDDLDAAELEKYIDKAIAAGRIDYPYTNTEDILSRLKLMENGVINKTAEVMFGKDPDTEIQMAIFATEEKLTFNDIYRKNGRIIDLVDIAERYIRNYMRYRVIIDGTQLQRKEIPEVPHIAIREALLNSFCHKNFQTPQNNEVAIFKNRIEIYNPGTFPEGMTPDDFINGIGQSVHRNPLLARIMYFSKDIENFGTGLKRIADACEEANVRYEFRLNNYGFTIIFYRPPVWISDKLEENLKIDTRDSIAVSDVDSIVDSDVDSDVDSIVDNIAISGVKSKILTIMHNNSRVSARQLSKTMGISPRNVQIHIKTLKEMGYIKRVGSPKNGYWVVKTGEE